MRTICAVTATRAEYGLLRPVLQKLAASDTLALQLVATGAHLCARLGATVAEIEADGLPLAARLPIFTDDADEPVARTIARTLTVFDGYFAAHRPDVVLLLGDRFEIFAVAAAAAARHIPIAHISGGDVTLGAADEYYRHCITKMAALHFPSCADSAARLVRMGEEPGRVFCVGCLGDENIRTLPKMTRQELCDSTGFALAQPFALVTYHPETSAGAPDPAVQAAALCAAMAAVPGVFWLITGSNAGLHPRHAKLCRRPPGPRRVCAEFGAAPLSFGHAVRRRRRGQFQLRRGGDPHLRGAGGQHRQPAGRAHFVRERPVLPRRRRRHQGRPPHRADAGFCRQSQNRPQPLLRRRHQRQDRADAGAV